MMLKLQCRIPSKFEERVLTTQLVDYLADLYIIFKNKNDLRKKIQLFLFNVITTYSTSSISLAKVPDLLVSEIS
jgi:hypothetical protein